MIRTWLSWIQNGVKNIKLFEPVSTTIFQFLELWTSRLFFSYLNFSYLKPHVTDLCLKLQVSDFRTFTKKNTVLSHKKPYKYSAKLQTRVLYLHRNSSRPEICREIECEQESRQLVKQAFNRLPAASRACQLKVSATVANTRLHIRTALITRIDTRDIKWVYLYKVYLKRGITKNFFNFEGEDPGDS